MKSNTLKINTNDIGDDDNTPNDPQPTYFPAYARTHALTQAVYRKFNPC